MKIGITGATGYLGRALSTRLMERGHQVRALVRTGSSQRVVAGVEAIELDVFDVAQLAHALQGCEAVVHLIGTPNPNPSKAQEFRRVDLGSALACIAAATAARIPHFVYVSVAQPAPLMQAYVAARAEAERALAASGLTASVLRPWYVLGPGHRWPVVLRPLYALAEWVPGWRESARRTGLVTLSQMTDALLRAVEGPPAAGAQRVIGVPQIRSH